MDYQILVSGTPFQIVSNRTNGRDASYFLKGFILIGNEEGFVSKDVEIPIPEIFYRELESELVAQGKDASISLEGIVKAKVNIQSIN